MTEPSSFAGGISAPEPDGRERILREIAAGRSFLLLTHENPDADGIGSMLALGRVLEKADREVVLLVPGDAASSFGAMKGMENVSRTLDPEARFDVVVALDVADRSRLGKLRDEIAGRGVLVNIDHHETNTRFGDLNLVDPQASSTGEIIYGLIRSAGFSLDPEAAGNLLAAIQGDTGSFRYENTTAECLRIAAEIVESGVRPWEVWRAAMPPCTLSRLRLLSMALASLELYHGGRLGMLAVTREMLEDSGARGAETEGFVEYVRVVPGVEIAALVRETDHRAYRFSLRSNDWVNVAELAARFGGGGHPRAAGFQGRGPLADLKEEFIRTAAGYLDGTIN